MARPKKQSAVNLAPNENDWNPQWNEMGGDVCALEAWSPRSGLPFAKSRSVTEELPSLQGFGTFIYRKDPTLLFQWSWFDNDRSKHSHQTWMTARRKGWVLATETDFALTPELRGIILVNEKTKQYEIPDVSGASAAFVMYRSKESYLRDREEQLKHSNAIDRIQKTTDDQGEALRRAGINASTSFTVEDSEPYEVDQNPNS